MSSLVLFENKNIFFYILSKNALAPFNAGVVIVNLEVVRLSPGDNRAQLMDTKMASTVTNLKLYLPVYNP
jgi:hypothetical protein